MLCILSTKYEILVSDFLFALSRYANNYLKIYISLLEMLYKSADVVQGNILCKSNKIFVNTGTNKISFLAYTEFYE